MSARDNQRAARDRWRRRQAKRQAREVVCMQAPCYICGAPSVGRGSGTVEYCDGNGVKIIISHCPAHTQEAIAAYKQDFLKPGGRFKGAFRALQGKRGTVRVQGTQGTLFVTQAG
jgi:hypothetical protein